MLLLTIAEIIENVGKGLIFGGFLLDNTAASVFGFFLYYSIDSAKIYAKQRDNLQKIENQLEKILNEKNSL